MKFAIISNVDKSDDKFVTGSKTIRSIISITPENKFIEEKINGQITPIEFKLLLKLIQNNQKVLSRQQLLDSVWGNGVYIEDRSIDKHISAIRKKIHPFGELIKTMSGVGYKFQM